MQKESLGYYVTCIEVVLLRHTRRDLNSHEPLTHGITPGKAFLPMASQMKGEWGLSIMVLRQEGPSC